MYTLVCAVFAATVLTVLAATDLDAAGLTTAVLAATTLEGDFALDGVVLASFLVP